MKGAGANIGEIVRLGPVAYTGNRPKATAWTKHRLEKQAAVCIYDALKRVGIKLKDMVLIRLRFWIAFWCGLALGIPLGYWHCCWMLDWLGML